MSCALPKGFVRDAWKAIVGYSLLSVVTQRAAFELSARALTYDEPLH